jgi:hypothetical protein
MLKFQLLTPRTYLHSAPRQNAAHDVHARHCYALRLRLDVILASRAAARNLALPQQLHALAERRNALQQVLHQKLLHRRPRETQRRRRRRLTAVHRRSEEVGGRVPASSPRPLRSGASAAFVHLAAS